MAEPNDKDARGATNLRIKFRSADLDEFIERYAVDVSKGGIFIRTREPLSVGSRLNLDFQLLEAAPLLQGEGTVVWIRQPDASRTEVTPGMGVRFDKLTADSQTRLDKILEEKDRLAETGKTAGGKSASSKSAGGIAVRRPTGAFLPTDAGLAKTAATDSPAAPAAAGDRPASPPTPPFGASLTTSAPGATAPGQGAPGQPAGDKPPATPPRISPFAPGRARRASGPMSTFRSASAQTFEPPTADDIDRALSVLEDKPGPVPAMPPPPRIVPGAPIAVVDDGSNEPTRVVSDPQEFGVHEAVTGRVEVLPESDLSDSAIPELKEDLVEDMTSRAGGDDEATMAASPAAFAAAELVLGAGSDSGATKPAQLNAPLGAHLEGPAGAAPPPVPSQPPQGTPGKPPAIAREKEPRAKEKLRPGKPPRKASLPGVEAVMPSESGRFRTDATYRRPRTAAKRVGLVVVVLALAGAGFAFRDRLRALYPKSEVAQLPLAPPPPPEPQATAAADGGLPGSASASANAGAVDGAASADAGGPAQAIAPPTPSTEPKPPAHPKPEPAIAKPGPEPRAKRKPGPRAPAPSGVIESETKPVADKPATPPGEAKPPGETEAKPAGEAASAGSKEPPLTPTPETPAAAPTMLRIASVPNGARVLLDGVPVGTTPLSIKDIDPNSDHAITVQKEGFDTQERQFGASSWTHGKGATSLKMNVKLRRIGSPAPPSSPSNEAPKDKPSDVEIVTPDS